MKSIHKFEVKPNGITMMPEGAIPFSCRVQGPDEIMVWALVDPHAPSDTKRLILAMPTGQHFSETHYAMLVAGNFLGTVELSNGIIFHCFDGGIQRT